MAASKTAGGRKLEWTAFFLALFGLAPFAFLTLLLVAQPGLLPFEMDGPSKTIVGPVSALKAYAAIILSFLGGIRWGMALMQPDAGRRESEVLVLSVLPSLVGWFAFFLAAPWSFAVFGAAFAVMGWWDWRRVKAGGVPAWFGRLRLLLSILVTGTMLTAFAATL
jgi:Protein of unknown function (DUF3429)